MKAIIISIILLLITISPAEGQTITKSIPPEVSPSQKYLFYLHGGIVQEQGVHAVSRYYGAYKYLDILDTLRSHGYNIISEARPKGTDEVKYAEKVAVQIDSLLNLGVTPENIILVGASLGAYITMETAYLYKHEKISYVVIGLCSEYALNYYSNIGKKLYGNFLSIYESSDQKGSCDNIFREQPAISSYKEIKLNMGIGHGFLYKPYQEWVIPLIKWINE